MPSKPFTSLDLVKAHMSLDEAIEAAENIVPAKEEQESLFFIRIMDRVRILQLTFTQFKRMLCFNATHFSLDFSYSSALVGDVLAKLLKYLKDTKQLQEDSVWVDVAVSCDNSLFWIHALNISRAIDLDETNSDPDDDILVIHCESLTVPLFMDSPRFDSSNYRLDPDTVHFTTDSAVPILIQPFRPNVGQECMYVAQELKSKLFSDHVSEFECKHGVDGMQGAQCPQCNEDDEMWMGG